MKFRRINNQIVRPMQTPDDMDKRPPRGEELISAPYANIFCCSKKKTGKTSVIAKLIMNFVGKDTKVYLFSSTAFIDPTYKCLGKWLDAKKIDFYPSTSIRDNGSDLLEDILKENEDWVDPEDEVDEDKPEPKMRLLDLSERTPKRKKKKVSKYKELRSIFVFDDLSTEIRHSNSLKRLLKLNRHLLCKTIVSSQWVNDLDPQSISQLDYTLLFKSHSDEKLVELHKKLDLSMPVEEFVQVYKFVTQDKTNYNFLYITRFDELRLNFNTLIILEEQ